MWKGGMWMQRSLGWSADPAVSEFGKVLWHIMMGRSTGSCSLHRTAWHQSHSASWVVTRRTCRSIVCFSAAGGMAEGSLGPGAVRMHACAGAVSRAGRLWSLQARQG